MWYTRGMKMIVFYQPDSEKARKTEEYLRDLVRTHDIDERKITVLNPNTREGSVQASLYDVVSYPGIVVTDDFGQYIKSWSGELPLMDELMAYSFTGSGLSF